MINRKNITIQLTQTDPLERLDEFCAQTKYFGRFYEEEFNGGILCHIKITGGQPNSFSYAPYLELPREIISETRYIDGSDQMYARRVLAAIVLDKLGLGVEDETPVVENEEKSKISRIMETIKNMKFDLAKGLSDEDQPFSKMFATNTDFAFSALNTLLGESFNIQEDDEELEPENSVEDCVDHLVQENSVDHTVPEQHLSWAEIVSKSTN